MRRIVSLTAGLTFILVLLTSIVLYIAPQGRVAYWADWHLWGLSKTDWGNIHINLGLLFLIALGLHIYYNWKPLLAYLKDKAKRIKVLTWEFNIALIITAVFTLGTYFLVPPFDWVMTLNDHFKDAAAEKYGEPPYGHAELSTLKSFAGKMNLDIEKSLQLLEKAGYPTDRIDISLADIAKRYGVPPQQIYAAIAPAAIKADGADVKDDQLPDAPPPGTGNLSLADFCRRHHLDIKQVLGQLSDAGITATEDATLKTIAAEHQTSPLDLYEKIKTLVN